MKLLWIPQMSTSSNGWDGSRHYHLLRHLSRIHDIHVITWEHANTPRKLLGLGRCTTTAGPFGTEHHVALAPSIYRLVTEEYPNHMWLLPNQRVFRAAVTNVMQSVRPDVCVYSASHHATGYPPVQSQAPVVFEYLDYSPPAVAQFYVEQAQAIVAVTERLAGEIDPCGKAVSTIPNGVDVARYSTLSREEAKREMGWQGRRVISLIGLTCSRSLYFMDAIAELEKRQSDLLFVYAGTGPTADGIAARAAQLGIQNIATPGAVPNTEVHRYFAATDVGLYPGDDNAYYRGALPLKIIEYTAAGAQVVTSPVDYFRSGWTNVHTTAPDAGSFVEAILGALERPQPIADVNRYDWSRLASEFDSVLRSVCVEAAQCAS